MNICVHSDVHKHTPGILGVSFWKTKAQNVVCISYTYTYYMYILYVYILYFYIYILESKMHSETQQQEGPEASLDTLDPTAVFYFDFGVR